MSVFYIQRHHFRWKFFVYLCENDVEDFKTVYSLACQNNTKLELFYKHKILQFSRNSDLNTKF